VLLHVRLFLKAFHRYETTFTRVVTIATISLVVALAALLVPPIHMYHQLKGTYGLTRMGAAWRTAALLLIVTIASTLYVGLLFYLGSE